MIRQITHRVVLGLVLAGALAGSAAAQQAVTTIPSHATNGNGSGTIAVTNTFQSIFAAVTTSRGRVGCLVQNNGTHSMWVYFGPIANATKGGSVVLGAGVGVSCATSGGAVLQDQVSITGTGTEAFYAGQQ